MVHRFRHYFFYWKKFQLVFARWRRVVGFFCVRLLLGQQDLKNQQLTTGGYYFVIKNIMTKVNTVVFIGTS